MSDIKTLIIEAAYNRDLTYAENFNGRAYALMDADWIGYFDTLDEVLEYLGISVEIDKVNDVLNKIKAEVEQLPITDTAISLVNEILDKYKGESEE